MRNPFVFKFFVCLIASSLLSGCFAGAKKARIQRRADDYFKSGELEKAKIEYLNLLRIDNQNPKTFQQLGFIWMEEGAPVRAIPFLMKVRQLAPQNSAAREKLAQGLLDLNQYAEARKEASALLRQNPTNQEALLVLAKASQNKDEIDEAKRQLELLPGKETVNYHLAVSAVEVKTGDLGGASDEVQQALALDPKSAPAHSAKAYLYALRKDLSHAGSELKAASDLSPFRSSAKINYVEFQIANRAVPDARVLAEGIVKRAPDYLPAWRVLAQIYLNERKYDDALSALENVFSRDPENPGSLFVKSDILIAKSDSVKALSIVDKLNAAHPKNPIVKFQIARAQIQNKNFPQAEAALQEAIALEPNFTGAVLALGELNLQARKPQAVVAATEELLKKNPNLPQARLVLADAYRELGRFDDAAELFRNQIKLEPKTFEPYYRLGVVLREQKKINEARQAFQTASDLAPNNLNPLNQLIELDIAEKRFDIALQRVQQQLVKDPTVPGIYFIQAQIFAAQKDWPRTETAAKKAIEVDRNAARAYDVLFQAYLAQNKLTDAIDEAKSVIKQYPRNVRALTTMAVIYERLGDYPSARDSYEKVLALTPDSAVALNNLAYLYAVRFNQLDKAYEVAQRARNVIPGSASSADTLGWVLYLRGDYQQAQTLLAESASKVPNNPEVQFHLGMAEYMMGHIQPALAALQKATSAPIDFRGKDEAQRKLTALQSAASTTGGQSIEQLEASAKQQPNDLVILQHLGQTYENNRQYDKAATTYSRAFKLNPKLGTVALKLAQLYSGPLGKPDQALDLARQARDLSPNDPGAIAAIGHIALQAGNYTWAYSLLQEGNRKGAETPPALRDLAASSYALGKVSDARDLMQRCLKSAQNEDQSTEIKRFLFLTAFEQPSPDVVAAEPEVDKTLMAHPEYVPALIAKAAIQLQQNNEKAAAETYLKVLQKYPDFVPAQKRLAAIYVNNPDDLVKAYGLAMKARKALPDDPELARTLAQISFKRKEYPYSAQLYEEVARKQPLKADDLYYLGVAQFGSRQDEKARQTLARALAAGLSGPLAEEARRRLAADK